MSALYDLFENPPSPDGEKQPLHARIVSKGTVDKEEFLDRVHKFTGISRSLLAGAMEAFANEARDLLAVRLECMKWEIRILLYIDCNVRRLKIKKKFGQRLSK